MRLNRPNTGASTPITPPNPFALHVSDVSHSFLLHLYAIHRVASEPLAELLSSLEGYLQPGILASGHRKLPATTTFTPAKIVVPNATVTIVAI